MQSLQSLSELSRTQILKILDSLGDPFCIDVLHEVVTRPSTVTEVAQQLHASTSTVWKKMKTMSEAGLITGTKKTGKEGKMTILYHLVNLKLDTPTVRELLDTLATRQ
jgi:predicted transcriptional regulator